MASLQQTLVSMQSKLPPSSDRILRSLPLRKSFPLRIGRGGGAAGARMVATAAGSYATALADVAKSNNTLDSTSADVEKIEKVFSDQQVVEFFANPTVTVEKKREVLDEIAKSSSLQPHTENFLNILVDANRIEMVSEIVKEFEAVYNKLTDTELAVVSSVVKLEPPQLAQIAKQVQKLTGARNVRIKTVIDPELVAGFTIRYGNSGSKLIDMSVKKQLEDIAAQLDLGDIQLAS
ncbi:PREDICTED: ATP synthase subunit delta, chloroplastic-like [Tarenaya hassleriana]|uniref:ATP synthase subunit delta, chloroplastic-like n=1 Tax=Tarenaya hassleriana TaxID=28532 RepID=UPI00053C589E|nr:PREDICTED: ATP synthase subunit delta, chloroplastic-like [Tarenaya hassleriana]